MPNTSYTGGTAITVTIPDLTDTANIVSAFGDYHTTLAPAIVAKANIATPIFTGVISANSGTWSGSGVTVIGQANAAISGARYNANTSGTFDGNAILTEARRIFVSKATPTANLSTGDVWISWT